MHCALENSQNQHQCTGATYEASHNSSSQEDLPVQSSLKTSDTWLQPKQACCAWPSHGSPIKHCNQQACCAYCG